MKAAIFSSILMGVTLVTACSIDAYEKGDGEYSLMTAEMVDATVGSDKYVTTVDTDEGERLMLDAPVKTKWMEKGDTTYRALLYYNAMEGGKIEAISFNKVGVLIPANEKNNGKIDSLKTDPLYVESIWMSKNKKYVNMRLRLLTGAADDEKAVHTLGLFRDTTANHGHEHFTLYHHQGSRPEYYSTTVFVSIPLAKVQTDTLTIVANTYDGPFSRTFIK